MSLPSPLALILDTSPSSFFLVWLTLYAFTSGGEGKITYHILF